MVKVKGIKRGQTLELLESINIPDGAEITIYVEFTQPLNEQEKLTKLNQIFGGWRNQTELNEIFTEIDQERHAYLGRKIELLDE